ncbi:MAG: tRNA (pseudouridine(54)-N(1))-methyltransferase TrmY [Gammaproteobacteria bacterium]|nr:tRNA (pseudouridine(54)-N(1))-methyltransferase TrmY [Gammaproteobacteria bacterium]
MHLTTTAEIAANATGNQIKEEPSMRIFVIRARKGTTEADKVLTQVGSQAHFEIIAHSLANAFYFSNGMRSEVEVYVVLDSSPHFPKTLKFSSNDNLSFPGFHEGAILNVIASALKNGEHVEKDKALFVAPGIEISGFGFEVLIKKLQAQYPIFLLDKKGEDVRSMEMKASGVFILSDHLSLPKNNIKALERQGAKKISLGKKMLFASQCVVLIHNELDRQCG